MGVSIIDLDYISQRLNDQFSFYKDSNLFITGGTGFIGKWLLESIVYTNKKLNLNIKASVLTRNSQSFIKQYPYIVSNDCIDLVIGDVRDFKFPEKHFNYIIHAATEASVELNDENPLLMADVIVSGTKHVLEFAQYCKASKVLFLSSGAIYGKKSSNLKTTPESFFGLQNHLESGVAYAESKRFAEFLCSTYARQYHISIPIARCFAFVGPYLPLDKHFAIGNFISDGLNGRNIVIRGDGTPLRSYMYASDLVIWLLTILHKGKSGEAYNVGSGIPISIKDLAEIVAEFFPSTSVKILNQTRSTDRNQDYVPDITKAKSEFHFGEGVSIRDSIYKTIQFHKQNE